MGVFYIFFIYTSIALIFMKETIRKYFNSELNKLEEQKLYNWIESAKENKELFKSEMNSYLFSNTSDENVNTQIAFEEFRNSLNDRNKLRSLKKFSFNKYLKYAATITILITGIYFFNRPLESTDENKKNQASSRTEDAISNKIILTLEDGSTKILEQTKEELSYLNNAPSKELLVYNQITIPKGQIFRLILSDGTIVWLNADTKLKYPKKFLKSLESRTVELEGEAFFEVAHDTNKPFVVNTNGVDVKVLGTKFNVSSYDDDNMINTTLVEGSVEIIDDSKSDNSIVINPNYQASFNKNKLQMASKKVNTAYFTSWLQKRIIFTETPFSELVKKIERTYNVEIINDNENVKNELFTGEFDIENVDVIFEALSTSGNFKYEINENKITIKN